ncbi:MAG: hypothetical protein JXQ67_06340 [Campylobacterales bacterium]|nr:hypothetical protein [Campylobacterales bacterium]
MRWLTFIFISLLLGSSLKAYTDTDWDGVEDAFDECPQTPFSELVNAKGCTIQNVGPMWSGDVIVGVSSSDTNSIAVEKTNTTTLSLQADLYYKQWWIQGVISHYNFNGTTSTSGMEDSVINLFYNIPLSEKITFIPGVGVVLPTYKTGYGNEAMDYTFMAELQASLSSNLYGYMGYGYVVVNDSDIVDASYQNANAYHVGMGYMISSHTNASLQYHVNDSIYVNDPKSESISVGIAHKFSYNWFATVEYSKYINDSLGSYYTALRVGYSF